jgi:diguanylate cyclase (GGDEF)-like protein
MLPSASRPASIATSIADEKGEEIAQRKGEGARDVLLSDTGRFLSDAVRSTDKVARIAYDKFAHILPHTGRRGASEMANRLCLSLPDPSARRDTPEYLATASFGIVSSEGTPITAKDMMERADAALDEATKAGGHRVIVWTPLVSPRTPELRT